MVSPWLQGDGRAFQDGSLASWNDSFAVRDGF